MKIAKNRTMTTSIALFLIIAMMGTLFLIYVPEANALTHTESDVFGFITVAPDPVGVGQNMYISMWLIEYHPLSTSNNNPGTVWEDYTLTITKPDGTTEVKVSDASPAASWTFIYIPDQVGTYHFKFYFPGQNVTTSTINNYYRPTTAETSSVVQQEPIEAKPETPLPLPNQYWERPINWENQYWWPISGNWFGDIQLWNNWQEHGNTQGYQPDSVAPASAHVLWRFPIAFGGQIGGSMYTDTALSNYFTGKSYKEFFEPPVILNGIMYYSSPLGIPPRTGVTAVDLRTGKEIWHNEQMTQVDFGQIYSEHNPNEVGGWAYLWDGYKMYDANTGRYILTVTGVSGTQVINEAGELLVYRIQAINQTHGFLSMWNSTACVGSSSNTNPWTSWSYDTPANATLSYLPGIMWNVTVPIYPQTGTSVSIQFINDGVILIAGSLSIQDYQTEAGYDAYDGHLLWHTNRSVGMHQETNAELLGPAADGIYVEHNKEIGTYYGFDLHTGDQIWGPTTPDTNAWDSYGRQGIGDGTNFYIMALENTIAFDAHTGEEKWVWHAPPAGLEANSPYFIIEGAYNCLVGGGLMFIPVSNSHGDQLFRGAKMYAVNTTTGLTEYEIQGFYGEAHSGGHALADGILVAQNEYDNEIYMIGKGLSATTVTAPTTVQTLSSTVLLQGTVTDQSPGQTCLGIPAAGTPAIADASMTEWMAYLYMQQLKPNNATGVPVSLDTIDPNGNYVHIGDTTSDINGMYKFMWTPEISGAYTIIASFAGSDSYFASSGQTVMGVVDAPPTPAPTQALGESTADMYFVPAIAGLFVLVIITLIAVVLLMFRKKP